MDSMKRLAFLSLLLVLPGLRASAGDEFDEREGNAFFTRPDRRTAAEIEEHIARFAHGSVQDRLRSRSALETIGYWAVDPLIEAAREKDPPVKCASIVTLEAIGDPRAVAPLRELIADGRSHPYVSGFAALALGRYRDPGAVPVLAEAVRSKATLSTLRAAAPLALARIGGPAAETELLSELSHRKGGQEPVRSARFLALGFFPRSARNGETAGPSDPLLEGLESKRQGEREAALLGFLVATVHRRDTQAFLAGFIDREKAPVVLQPALIGLSRYEGEDVSAFLAETAAGRGDDEVRLIAAELLYNRADLVALEPLLRLVRGKSPSRLRARAVLALARIPSPDAEKTVLSRLADTNTLVRAASAVACVRLTDPAARQRARQEIDGRLGGPGESSPWVRRMFQLARSALEEGRTDVRWAEVLDARVFQRLDWTYEDFLLDAVNVRAENCLDLAKITNLQTDVELESHGPGDFRGEGDNTEGVDESDGEPDATPGEIPPVSDPSNTPVTGPQPDAAPAPGAPRTTQYQELRDLKIRLRQAPYFGLDDLPSPPEPGRSGNR